MADVLVGVERWPSNRTDRCSPIPWPLPTLRDDRCRRVVAIRDDILLRLEQRMSAPRRPNVRKFHYAFQSVQEARLAKRVTRARHCDRQRVHRPHINTGLTGFPFIYTQYGYIE